MAKKATPQPPGKTLRGLIKELKADAKGNGDNSLIEALTIIAERTEPPPPTRGEIVGRELAGELKRHKEVCDIAPQKWDDDDISEVSRTLASRVDSEIERAKIELRDRAASIARYGHSADAAAEQILAMPLSDD